MKQALRFQSEQEFQNFFGQLSSAEMLDFQAVEGSGGDGGFDGISGATAFQVYFPEEKNRTNRNYINKIDTDVDKALKTKEKLGLNLTEWVLVVPEDLRIEVISHLQKKSHEKGIVCKYWGATKLLELITKYPYVQDSFPTIFLPPVRKGVKDIQDILEFGQKPKVLSTVEIISDQDYKTKREIIIEEYKNRTRSFMNAHGTASSAYLAADRAYQNECNVKLKELHLKKEASDKAYQLELDEINEHFNSLIEKTNEEMAENGLYNSGARGRAVGKIQIQCERTIARLKLKFGKSDIK